MGLDHTGTHVVHFLGTFTFVVWIKCPRYIQSHEIKDIEYRYVSARCCPVKQTGPWCLISDSSISLIWLPGSAANNSEEHQSKACRTAWEVLAAKPHSETRFLGNYRDTAAYGQGGRSFTKGFLFETFWIIFMSLISISFYNTWSVTLVIMNCWNRWDVREAIITRINQLADVSQHSKGVITKLRRLICELWKMCIDNFGD